jgi:hypothetical protein
MHRTPGGFDRQWTLHRRPRAESGVTAGAFCRYHRSMPSARRFPPPWTIEGLSSVHCKNAGGIEAKILVELNKQAIRHSQREGKAMDVIRLPQSFRRTAILEAAALIILTGLVIAFVHSVVPYITERL